MEYTGGSLFQGSAFDNIVAGLTGATGTEGVILSNHSDFTTKNTTYTTKNTSQDGTLASLETKATNLETGATGLENRNSTLNNDYLAIQNRESALLVGLTGTAGSTGLEARSVGFSNKIVAINNQLNGEIQTAINTKVADSIFDALTNEFTQDFEDFQTQLNQKVVTATQEALDARQDGDDAVLEKKFCSVEEFAQTFQQTYTIKKTDNTYYNFDGKIQKVDKAPPIFSIVEKAQNTTITSAWDLKIKLTDYGYNVMSGNLVVKNGTGVVVNTLTKNDFNVTTKLYTLSLLNSNSNGSLINGPFTFEYRASTSTAVYELILNSAVLTSIPVAAPTGVLGNAAWGRWVGGSGNDVLKGITVTSEGVYITGVTDGSLITIGMTLPPVSPSGSQNAFIIKYDFNGSFLWGNWIAGGDSDQGLGISATTEGVYVTGYTLAALTQTFPAGFLTDMGTKPSSNEDGFVIKYSTSGVAQWGRWISGAGLDRGLAISATSEGVYVTGYAGDTLLQSFPGMGAKPSALANLDCFVVKYNTSGVAQWGQWISGTGIENGRGICATTEGVYITGAASEALTDNFPVGFLTDMGTKPSTVVGNYDTFVIKYNTSGTAVWGRWIGGTGNGDLGNGISVTSEGVYITGQSNGSLLQSFPGMGSPTASDAFVIKYNLNGVAQWGRWIGGTWSVVGNAISTTSEGVYVTGRSNVSLTGNFTTEFITDMGTKPSTASNNFDGFIIKFNLNGLPIWGRWVGGSGYDEGLSISAINDAVYVAGTMNGTIIQPSNIISSMGTKPGTSVSPDTFIIKYV